MTAVAAPVLHLALLVAVPGVLLSRAAGFSRPRGSAVSCGFRLRPFFGVSAPPDPCCSAAAVLSCGIGAAMALQWALYAVSARTVPVQKLLLAVHAAAAAAMAVRTAVAALRERRPIPQFSEAVFAVGAVAMLGALSAACAAGAPYTHWDAVLSWDKWATDAAARPGLGRHVCGGYPLGVPLLMSAALQVAGPEALDPLSAPHLAAAGALHALFAFAALFSVVALARRFGASASVSLAALVFLPAVRASLFDPARFGLADLPVAAATLGALAVASRSSGFFAMSAAFFGMLFAKGNGLAFLPAVVLAAVFSGGSGSPWRIVSAAASALALALPFWIHQWWFGVHLDMPGADPLMHSMEVFAAHTRLFAPDAAHFARLLRAECSAALPGGPSGGAALAAFVLALAACLALPLLRRRTAPPAALAAAFGTLWFFTASYDTRNAVAAECLLALSLGASARILVDAVLRLPALRNRSEKARILVRTFPFQAAVILLALGMCAGAGHGIADGTRDLPARFRKTPESRAAEISDVKFFHDFWCKAPWAERAAHIVAFSCDVRLWKGKGVYAMQRPALRDARPGDLFFSYLAGGREVRPPEPFAPVATVANHRLGRTLFEASPALGDVPFSATLADGGRAVMPGEILPAGTKVRIAVETDLRGGVAEISFDRPVPGAALSLSPESVRRDPYAKLFKSVSDGAVARTVWWTRKAAGPPVFEATLPAPAAVAGFRLGP